MNPENVNPKNFEVKSILYNSGSFSIAYGTWEEEPNENIAMRWNGGESEIGYPKVFNHPMWFQIDGRLTLPILKTLIGLEHSNTDSIIEALSKINK